MQSVIKGEYFLMDRTLKSVNFFNASMPHGTVCIYEVIRITHANILFWNDHLQRLLNSFKVAEVQPLLRAECLLPRLKMLIAANSIDEGNIKLEYQFLTSEEQQFMAYFIPAVYPNKEQQTLGIKCSLQFSERHHPTAKIFNIEVRSKANTIIEQRDVYETLLVNHDNCMTEGSRSNLFFIKNDTLITAEDSVVLPGIIRKQTLDLARQAGIPIQYRAVSVEDVEEMDAAFISGTSPRLLAIAFIGRIAFKVDHPIFIKLKQLLDQRIKAQL